MTLLITLSGHKRLKKLKNIKKLKRSLQLSLSVHKSELIKQGRRGLSVKRR
jgi:hypothetical protein